MRSARTSQRWTASGSIRFQPAIEIAKGHVQTPIKFRCFGFVRADMTRSAKENAARAGFFITMEKTCKIAALFDFKANWPIEIGGKPSRSRTQSRRGPSWHPYIYWPKSGAHCGPTKVGRGHAAKVLFASNPKKQRSIAQEVVAGSVFLFAGPHWAGRFETGSSAMSDGSRKRRISDNLVRRRWYAEHRARRSSPPFWIVELTAPGPVGRAATLPTFPGGN